MKSIRPPIDHAWKALKNQGRLGPKALHTSPMSAHPFTGLSPPLLLGAIRAVFGPVGFGDVPAAAQDAFLHVLPVEQGGAQTFIQRQHSGPKPATNQGVRNRLWADTFLPIVQQEAVAVLVIAAAMYQPPDGPVL
jgi:hypothetical protein